jgi:hypothetical protein
MRHLLDGHAELLGERESFALREFGPLHSSAVDAEPAAPPEPFATEVTALPSNTMVSGLPSASTAQATFGISP